MHTLWVQGCEAGQRHGKRTTVYTSITLIFLSRPIICHTFMRHLNHYSSFSSPFFSSHIHLISSHLISSHAIPFTPILKITVRGHIKLTDFGLAAPWVKDSSTLNKKSLGDVRHTLHGLYLCLCLLLFLYRPFSALLTLNTQYSILWRYPSSDPIYLCMYPCLPCLCTCSRSMSRM